MTDLEMLLEELQHLRKMSEKEKRRIGPYSHEESELYGRLDTLDEIIDLVSEYIRQL